MFNPDFNEDQAACFQLLSDWRGGDHHCPRRVETAGPRGITCCIFGGIATYDFAQLTALVVLAHDRCIRVEINGAAPNYLRLLIHRRYGRTGDSAWERHPTLEEHVQRLRPSPVPPA